MRKHLFYISQLKMTDLILQTFAFVVMLVAVRFYAAFAMYIMAGVQLLSCIAWSVQRDIPVPAYRRAVIMPMFLTAGVVICSALLLLAGRGELFVLVSICLIFLGPVLGVWYFMVTAAEVAWYRKAALPSYQ